MKQARTRTIAATGVLAGTAAIAVLGFEPAPGRRSDRQRRHPLEPGCRTGDLGGEQASGELPGAVGDRAPRSTTPSPPPRGVSSRSSWRRPWPKERCRTPPWRRPPATCSWRASRASGCSRRRVQRIRRRDPGLAGEDRRHRRGLCHRLGDARAPCRRQLRRRGHRVQPTPGPGVLSPSPCRRSGPQADAGRPVHVRVALRLPAGRAGEPHERRVRVVVRGSEGLRRGNGNPDAAHGRPDRHGDVLDRPYVRPVESHASLVGRDGAARPAGFGQAVRPRARGKRTR